MSAVTSDQIVQLQTYLRNRGWQVETDGALQSWERDGRYLNVLTVINDYADGAFHDTLDQLSKAENRPIDSILEEMTDVRVGRMSVYFDGEPVNSQGIDVSFAPPAIEALRKLVDSVFDASRRGALKSQGRFGRTGGMRISGVVRGSFGFTLVEDGSSLPLFDEVTPLAHAMDGASALLASLSDTETLDDVLAETDPRVVTSLKKFVRRMNIGKATVRVVGPHSDIHLDRIDIKRAHEILDSTSQDEREADYEGTLWGVLPRARTFEFTATREIVQGEPCVLDKERPLDGRIQAGVSDEDVAEWLGRGRTTQRIRVKHITTRSSSGTRQAIKLCAVWRPGEPAPMTEDEFEEALTNLLEEPEPARSPPEPEPDPESGG